MGQDARMVLERALSNGVPGPTMNRAERRNALDLDRFRATGEAFVGYLPMTGEQLTFLLNDIDDFQVIGD